MAITPTVRPPHRGLGPALSSASWRRSIPAVGAGSRSQRAEGAGVLAGLGSGDGPL